MSPARHIDGKACAAALRETIAEETRKLKKKTGIRPGLGVIRIGEDPASAVYVRNKDKAAKACGFHSVQHILDAGTKQAEAEALVREMNADPSIHGILVQLPLPEGLQPDPLIEAVDPAKDVDGFHPLNAGALATGRPATVPCTPAGCLWLLKKEMEDITGKRALVVGRSAIVGRPMAQLLLTENATVTMAHSRTKDLAEECRRAEILISAVGRPHIIKGDWVRKDAVVLDVGITRQEPPEGGKARLIGDVDFDSAAENAAAITPVPGGVGPMTIAMLLRNTLMAACNQHTQTVPESLLSP